MGRRWEDAVVARRVGEGVPNHLANLDITGLVDEQHLPRATDEPLLLLLAIRLLEEGVVGTLPLVLVFIWELQRLKESRLEQHSRRRDGVARTMLLHARIRYYRKSRHSVRTGGGLDEEYEVC